MINLRKTGNCTAFTGRCDRIYYQTFSSGNLTEQQSEQTAGLLYVTNNIQRIADRCQDIDGIWDQIESKE